MLSMIVIINHKLDCKSVKYMESYFSIEFKKLANETFYGINTQHKLKLTYHNDFFKIIAYSISDVSKESRPIRLISEFINNKFKEEITGIYIEEASDSNGYPINNILNNELSALVVS